MPEESRPSHPASSNTSWSSALSWLIALPEYLFQVPANRMGHAVYTLPQLKTLQEVITLTIFIGFSVWYMGEPLKWNHLAGFALMVVAAWLIFQR